MKFRIFLPTEALCQVILWNIYTYLKLIFYMGIFSNNAVFLEKICWFHITHNVTIKINRDDIVKSSSFQRVFISVAGNHKMCGIWLKWRALHGQVKIIRKCSTLVWTWPETKQHSAVIRNDSSVLFIVI